MKQLRPQNRKDLPSCVIDCYSLKEGTGAQEYYRPRGLVYQTTASLVAADLEL